MSAATSHSLPYDPATVEFDPLLRRLNLANTRRHWRQLIDRAETHGWSCREFLGVLISEEISHRQQTRIQRSVRQARFPFLKTVEEFDFSFQSSVRLPSLGSYLGPELVSGGRNLILQGKSGRGKSHLVIAIAYRAIQNGFSARFVTAAVLIESLSVASRQSRLQEQLVHYLQPHVLVIDEVGYLSYGPDAANVLFHIVNERHQRGRPMLFTTNKPPLTAWGDVLHDHDLAEAIVDRVLEHGRLLLLDGPSYRTRHLDLPAEDTQHAPHQPATVSGNHPADFPEPTPLDRGLHRSYRLRRRTRRAVGVSPASVRDEMIDRPDRTRAPSLRRQCGSSGRCSTSYADCPRYSHLSCSPLVHSRTSLALRRANAISRCGVFRVFVTMAPDGSLVCLPVVSLSVQACATLAVSSNVSAFATA